jgi:hypothetical protein
MPDRVDDLDAFGGDGWRSDIPAEPVPEPELQESKSNGAAALKDEVELDHARQELRQLLSADTWSERQFTESNRLLGDIITTDTKAFLVGRTGLGKTLFGMEIGAHIACGADFLHWKTHRLGNVLYVDGEMPGRLLRDRAQGIARRLRRPLGNLLIFGRDIEDEVRAIYPLLPEFAPLNTETGRDFILMLLKLIGPIDLIIFDNVMSLVAGNQKEEDPWSETMPLVMAIGWQNAGQLWLDHTGHDSSRQYGSSTKSWRFDLLGVMTPLTEAAVDPKVTAFGLSFDYPGKARRRTPDNWRDFQSITVRLQDDEWSSESAHREAGGSGAKVSPKALAQHRALGDALCISPTPGRTTKALWYAECVRLGLHDEVPAEAAYKDRHKITGKFRNLIAELKVANWIGVNGDTVTDLRASK